MKETDFISDPIYQFVVSEQFSFSASFVFRRDYFCLSIFRWQAGEDEGHE